MINNLKQTKEMNEAFKLPIYYNDKKVKLNQTIIDNLELVQTVDMSGGNPIYSYFFNSNNELSQNLISQMSQYYTTDQHFLKETQQLLKEYKKIDKKYIEYSPNYKNILGIWDEIKLEDDFKEKYYYVDWDILEFLNKSEQFLQFMSLYNLASPIISLFVPIIILIIPFFVIRMKGLTLTVSEYVDVLKVLAESHAIGKLFTKFSEVSANEKIYMLISAAFYVFSIYQNINVCVKFNNNMIKIHNHFKEITAYLEYTILSIDNYIRFSKDLSSQTEFNNTLKKKRETLVELNNKISGITEYKLTNIKKIHEIGRILKYFYELHDNKDYNDALMYSFGFNGYIDCLEGLIANIDEQKINFAQFTDKNKKTVFKNSYYASLMNNTPIKNTIKLNKNLIITGPNASGKTTILKSTLINIIFTQQFGCGFYDSAKINPYKYIHCYINIPDTSGRDSLFQAEARRCKEILDIVNSNKTDTHFCIFDELYSGTNPDEAVISATAFMEYLIKNRNVSCLLTTHYLKVAKKLKANKSILNQHMVTTKSNNKISYSYILKEGISEIKGGINVLCDMNYPQEIIDKTINLI
jgi:ABC-type multidrug transport system fused ATPase/permease subunit